MKFRVWHHPSKRFVKDMQYKYPNDDHWSDNGTLAISIDGDLCYDDYGNGMYSVENYKDYAINYSTGLKDKNNIEIYDGDIIQFDFDLTDNRSCVWKNYGYIWITDSLDIIMSYNHPYSENSERLKEFIEEEFDKTNFYPQLTIIGNIYENPGL